MGNAAYLDIPSFRSENRTACTGVQNVTLFLREPYGRSWRSAGAAEVFHELHSFVYGRIAALGLAQLAPEVGKTVEAFLFHPLLQGVEHRRNVPFAMFVKSRDHLNGIGAG